MKLPNFLKPFYEQTYNEQTSYEIEDDEEFRIVDLGNPNLDYNSLFSFYLTGLIEGKGSIIVPKRINVKKKEIKIKILLSPNDEKLGQELIKIIGGGLLEKNSKYYCLSFNTLPTVYTILKLINGKMKTEKYNQLIEATEFINYKYDCKYFLKIKPIYDIPLFINPWLAGYIDSKGLFLINGNTESKKINCRFEINEQLEKKGDLWKTMLKISYLFLNVANVIKKEKKSQIARVRITSLKGITKVIEYLEKYPLLSSKYLNYLDWKKAFEIIKSKKHLTKEGKKDLLNFKSVMNNNRKYYSWGHLVPFPYKY